MDFASISFVISYISWRLIVFNTAFIILSVDEFEGFLVLLSFEKTAVRIVFSKRQFFALVSGLLRARVTRVCSFVSPFLANVACEENEHTCKG